MKLQTHSMNHHSSGAADEQQTDTPQEVMQNVSNHMAKQSESMFNVDSFMNSAAAISTLAAFSQQANQMPMNADGYTLNNQLSAQIQTLCLAQLANLYQTNPMVYQHLYPLLGAIEHLRQSDPAQHGMLPSATSPLPLSNLFSGFDMTKLPSAPNATTTNKKTSNSNKTQRQNKKCESVRTPSQTIQTLSADTSNGNRSGSNFKIFKDEPIPKGYLKFRFNEDCNFPNCGYSNLQSHFHCCRTDCHYSFCDKTRFVQHTARHERLDKLMGDDFKQFRANMSCGYDDCVYKSNSGELKGVLWFAC